MLDESALAMPVSFALQVTLRIRRPWVAIVDECDVVPNENAFFNGDAFANECVAGDFTPRPDSSAFLDFNERTDLRFIADLAPVKIHESANPNIAPELYVGRYQLMRNSISIHARTVSRATTPMAKVIRRSLQASESSNLGTYDRVLLSTTARLGRSAVNFA